MQGNVTNAFVARWHCQPAAVAKAPGRVNLIGEHIDYEGYGVLPMAIQQACCIAAGWQPEEGSTGNTASSNSSAPLSLHVASIEPDKYPPAVLPLHPGTDLPANTPGWLKYVQAAYRGCVEFASSKQHPVAHSGTMLMMVGSSIPPAAGLSSSSALVVASALSLLQLWGLDATPSEVAEFTCKCECYVGTQGGGMDQAVSLLAQPGRAMHVEFNPVRACPVPLPLGAMFVVANSLTASAKAETASFRFNLRVAECRLAAVLLAHLLSAAGPLHKDLDWHTISVLQQVEPHLKKYAALQYSNANITTSSSRGAAGADCGEALAAAVRQLLPEEAYTLDQVFAMLGTSQQQLLDSLPERLQVAAAAADQLHLQQRACHVFTEASRVLAFKHTCEDAHLPPNRQLQQLGELLNASHTSCSKLYQCSCPELDTLVDTARAAGAIGARLTGAGWGGCIIALVQQDEVEAFQQQLKQQYYQPLVAQGVIAEDDVPYCLFASPPSVGATVQQHVPQLGPSVVCCV